MIGGGDVASIISAYRYKKQKRNLKEKLVDKSYYDKLELSENQKDILKKINNQSLNNDIKKSYRYCPECKKNFILITVNNIELDFCRNCKSIWFDKNELKEITSLSKDIPEEYLKSRNSEYVCPTCNEYLMEENIFIRNNNILVDRCKKCKGIYLEGGELKRIFYSISK